MLKQVLEIEIVEFSRVKYCINVTIRNADI